MIPSAVIIPEPDELRPRNGSTSPTLKRKVSQSVDHDRKRPRVDTSTDNLNYDEEKSSTPPPASAQSQSVSATTAASATSPTRRRSSALGSAVEEKKRNKRLFSGLLGVVSGSTTRSNPASKKRDEIEARARERQNRENEEQDAARQRRKDELNARRQREQKAWDEESLRVRHRNMRDMAAFLRTKSRPHLYYKPWELRPEEEEIIERQKREVEVQIREDLGEHGSKEPSAEHHPDVPQNGDEPDTATGEPPTDAPHETETQTELGEGFRNEPDQNGEMQPEQSEHGQPSQASHDGNDKTEEAMTTNGHGDENKDDHHHDGELVEGQEDDVIY